MPIQFNGRTLIEPQAASFVDDSGVSGVSAPAAGIVAILGTSTSGGNQPPFTPIPLSDPQTGRRLFSTGTLNSGIDRAFNHGASLVYAVRVNPATASYLALSDSTPAPTINLYTNDYGVYTSSIRVKVESGTNASATAGVQFNGALKVTIQTPSIGPNAGTTIAGDNLWQAPFSIIYNGTGTTPTYSVTATTFSATVATVTTDSITSLAFSTYTTIQALVDAINAFVGSSTTPRYTATLNGGINVGLQASTTLDAATNVAIPTTAATDGSATTGNVMAVRNAVITWINSSAAGNILTATSAVAGSLVVTTSVKPPALIPYTALAGGVDGTTVTANWTTGYTALQNINTDIIVPMSGDPLVHAGAQAHVDYMCGAGGKERIAICGGYIGETATTSNTSLGAVGSSSLSTRTSILNDENVVLVWPGPYDYDWQGILAYRDPFYTAPMVAGILAGGSVADAATHQYLKVQGLELQGSPLGVISKSIVEGALQLGVTCIEYANYTSARGYRVAQSITTWLNDNNPARQEVSTVRAKYYVARVIREALDQLIVGGRASQGLVSSALAITTGILNQMTDAGILVGNSANPSYKNLIGSINVNVLSISFTCSVAIPANYVLITAHLQAYSG